MAGIFFGLDLIPFSVTISPKCSISLCRNSDLCLVASLSWPVLVYETRNLSRQYVLVGKVKKL